MKIGWASKKNWDKTSLLDYSVEYTDLVNNCWSFHTAFALIQEQSYSGAIFISLIYYNSTIMLSHSTMIWE